jgi:hypothetical protein
MDLVDLVHAILARDLITARQWVSDARRLGFDWTRVEQPELNELELAVAAGIAEMLAGRAEASVPAWTAGISALQEPVVLDPGLELMLVPSHAKAHGPISLRKRNLIALPDFLDIRLTCRNDGRCSKPGAPVVRSVCSVALMICLPLTERR